MGLLKTTRKYNKNFTKAIELVKTFNYMHYEQLEECYNKLNAYAINYDQEVHDSIIIIGCLIHKEIIKIPYIQRFSDKYILKLNAKLANLRRYATRFKHGLFLTLTVDPNRYVNPKVMYKNLSRGFNVLMTNLRKKYGIKYYIKTLEFTSSNLPHLHIMLFHETYIPIQWVRTLWDKYNLGTIMRIEYVHTTYKIIKDDNTVIPYYPLDYIFKYITKHYEPKQQDEGKFSKTRVWQWALRARAYSISKALVSLIQFKTNSNYNDTNNSNDTNNEHLWQYIGKFNELEAQDFKSLDDVDSYLRQLYGN
jgi:hypothetical protein